MTALIRRLVINVARDCLLRLSAEGFTCLCDKVSLAPQIIPFPLLLVLFLHLLFFHQRYLKHAGLAKYVKAMSLRAISLL